MSAFDPMRGPQEPPKNMTRQMEDMISIWQAAAAAATDIAHAKRSMYLAYLAEGFTEAQALELARHL